MGTQTAALTILSLPNELLEAIAAAGQKSHGYELQRTFKSEWTLSHLCRRFRQVIVNTPALWTLVEADLVYKGSVEILKLYLERSGEYHISAALRSCASDDVPETFIEDRLNRLIVPHFNRIWRLRIVLSAPNYEWVDPSELWSDSLAPFRNIAAPNLRHLELQVVNAFGDFGDYSDSSYDSSEILRLGAPRLAVVKLSGFYVSVPLSRWIRTASLTHLELWRNTANKDDDNSVLVAIVAQCPFLVHLSLDNVILTSGPRVRVPSLKFLRIRILDCQEEVLLDDVISLFDCSALNEFIIHGIHGDQIFALFNSTNPRSSLPGLTTLTFMNDPDACANSSRNAWPIHQSPLRLFPALSSISLIDVCYTTNFAKAILDWHPQPWPLPATLTLCPKEGTEEVDEMASTLQDAVRSRRERGETLPRFRLSPTLSARMEWQEDGLEVEVFDPADLLSWTIDTHHSSS
ncbi:NmrA domain-containing protein [Mycena venus]|uniref:NmrA domain-containing protein n=1 Tax=Mycena venus TaxID=2733690 RepID=A0A8H7CPC5_9AGAR|nr:NmrA domain-containing protein [Mycena venus]